MSKRLLEGKSPDDEEDYQDDAECKVRTRRLMLSNLHQASDHHTPHTASDRYSQGMEATAHAPSSLGLLDS